jgi:hypothetical protein
MFEDNRSPVQLSTQCPHCQTPLQADVGALQRSKGWARCGRCYFLFDAVAHTGIPTLSPTSNSFADDTPTAAPVAAGTRQAVTQESPFETGSQLHAESQFDTRPAVNPDTEGQAPVDQPQALDAPSEDMPLKPAVPPVPSSWDALAKAMDEALPAAPGAAKYQPANNSVDVTHSAQGYVGAVADQREPTLDTRASGDNDVARSLTHVYGQAAQDAGAIERSDEALLAAGDQQATLMRGEPEDQALVEDSDGTGARWLVVSFALVLVLIALAQSAYYQRDWLVARMPQLQPYAHTLCKQVGCVIEPVKDMSQLRILSSSVMRLYSGELQLNITIENSGELMLGVPQIDVLLTDSNDQVFMTHTVVPNDWPDSPALLSASSRYPITVQWPTNDSDAGRMVGYKTQLRYAVR